MKAVAEIRRTLCNEHRYLNCSAFVIKKQISEDKMKGTVAPCGECEMYKYIVDGCRVGTSGKSCA